MRRLYRICPEPFLENYSGLGSSYKQGGRWNLAGVPVLYFALSPATALLEMGHYLPSPDLVPSSYRLGVYELPDDSCLKAISDQSLPSDWAEYPYPLSTQKLGSKWLRDRQVSGIIVPSCAVPLQVEKSVVLDPLHPHVSQLTLIEQTANLYNGRLFAGRG